MKTDLRRQPPFWLLATVTIASTMAMNMFVPALPIAGSDLGASNAAMQATIGVYIMGLAVGQLCYGPVADSVGRRPALMFGLALYVIGSVAAALATTLPILLWARLLQALGGCAGLALGRAIARDTSTPDNAVRRLALLNLLMMLGPSLSPLIGGVISSYTGWRAVFIVLSLIGLGSLTLSWRLLPETLPARQHFHIGRVAKSYRTLLGSRAFVLLSIGGGLTTTSMYAFVASAPFIFHDMLHKPLEAIGLYLGTLIFGMSLGNAVTSRLVTRLDADKLALAGSRISLAGAAALTVLTLADGLSVTGVLVCMIIQTCGAGIASPAILTRAISVDPKLVGSASGLYGCVQMVMGASCAALSGWSGNPALGAATVLLGAAILAQLCFRQVFRSKR